MLHFEFVGGFFVLFLWWLFFSWPLIRHQIWLKASCPRSLPRLENYLQGLLCLVWNANGVIVCLG